VLTGFRDDMQNYTGPVSMTSSGPVALQAYMDGDSEGTVVWGVGTSGSACAGVSPSGSTLTFQFVRVAG
jgi:hypothetical protein